MLVKIERIGIDQSEPRTRQYEKQLQHLIIIELWTVYTARRLRDKLLYDIRIYYTIFKVS